jgi:hypothetical protein
LCGGGAVGEALILGIVIVVLVVAVLTLSGVKVVLMLLEF